MNVPDLSFLRSPRVMGAAAALCLFGVGGGVLVNRLVVTRFLALPEGVERPEYAVVEGGESDAAGSSPRTMHPPKSAEPVSSTPETASKVSDNALASNVRIPAAREYAETIVRRNIFDSTAVYVEAGAVDGKGECKADSSVRLLATMVVFPTEYSTALIAEGGDRAAKSKPYKMNDMLGSDGHITLIEQKKVCTETNVCICMDQAVAKAPAAAATGEGAANGVEKLSENRFAVDRSVLDGAMGDMASLAAQLRASPHKGSDGEIDGFRLSGIRSNSLFSQLGIKNGDIIHTVNGTPLTSSEGAMSAYGSLKNQKSFSFEITRRNQRQTIEYEVR